MNKILPENEVCIISRTHHQSPLNSLSTAKDSKIPELFGYNRILILLWSKGLISAQLNWFYAEEMSALHTHLVYFQCRQMSQ
jgi:hypothetical protein